MVIGSDTPTHPLDPDKFSISLVYPVEYLLARPPFFHLDPRVHPVDLP
ncbi:MAG: hypothetical protein RLQ73_00590 [Hoeflea sp. D1-CHI-28]